MDGIPILIISEQFVDFGALFVNITDIVGRHNERDHACDGNDAARGNGRDLRSQRPTPPTSHDNPFRHPIMRDDLVIMTDCIPPTHPSIALSLHS
jgi:hypothetical protein